MLCFVLAVAVFSVVKYLHCEFAHMLLHSMLDCSLHCDLPCFCSTMNSCVYTEFFLQVFNAKKLSCRYVPHPYCILSLNEVKVCRTQIKEAPDAYWDEEFILE